MRRIGELEIFQCLHLGKVGLLNASCNCVAIALFDLRSKQRFQIAEMTLLLADRLFGHLRKLPTDRGLLQLLGILTNRRLLHGNYRGTH